ncbi:MAG: hypothetical protein HUU16_05965 [Candidatus Omnitrophica bacterium]|nr:hypothetical protein [Candidatus Omnitrophota bacterium]
MTAKLFPRSWISIAILMATPHSPVWGDEGVSPETLPQVTLASKAAPKGDCVDLYLEGYVSDMGGPGRVQGATVTLNYLDDEGVGNIIYFDQQSYDGGPHFYNPNGGVESHCITDAQGLIYIRVDVCPNQALWNADFTIKVEKVGYQTKSQVVEFTFDDTSDTRQINLFPLETPTPTEVATATPSPSESPTPTVTPTTVALPTAVHPELDVDQDGVIGPGDLLLLIADWMRPTQ